MNKFATLIFSVIVVLIIGCNNKIGKLIPITPPVVVSVADTIKFNKHIKPIINNNCAISGCHIFGFSNGDYTTYAGLNAKIVSGKFKLRAYDANPGPMPPSGKLPQAQLDSIKIWLDRGAPND
ncbi:MAG: hypothetical protein WCH21_02825 [Bacteroidota bacterium]